MSACKSCGACSQKAPNYHTIYLYQVDALGSALTLKADLTPGQTMRYALLHAAAANGQLEMARELLERGANVDVLGSGGETACLQSASLGSAPQPLG